MYSLVKWNSLMLKELQWKIKRLTIKINKKKKTWGKNTINNVCICKTKTVYGQKNIFKSCVCIRI